MPSSLYNPTPLFIQALLAQPSMSFEKAMSVYHRCLEACYDLDPDNHNKPPRLPDPAAFQRFRESINEGLEPLGLEVRDSNLPEYRQKLVDGKMAYENVKWIALINTVSDPLALTATSYSALEINYLKLIIHAIITSPHFAYSISTTSASRLAEKLKKDRSTQPLSNKQRETLLDRFTGVDGEGWLLRSKRGRYSLSPRALMELEDYLKKTYLPDPEDEEADTQPVLLLCELERCRRPVTSGNLCPQCASHGLHGSCMLAAMRRQNHKCPCGEEWDEDTEWLPVGESAVEDGEDDKGKGKKRAVVDSDDEMEEEEEASPRPQSTNRRASTTSTTSSRLASKSKAPPRKSRASAAKNKKTAHAHKRVAGIGEYSDADEEDEDDLQPASDQEEEEEIDELATPAPSQAQRRRRPANSDED